MGRRLGQYPNLARFLARYFHRDAEADRRAMKDAVRTSMRDGCSVEVVQQELEALLEAPIPATEIELEVGQAAPFNPGQGYRAWFDEFLSVLREREAAIYTLHRYFIWMNRMRDHLEQTLEAQGPCPDTAPGMSAEEREATEAAARQWFLPVFLYASYWFAGLYVVIEGWRELGLFDENVDSLLDATFLNLLRRYRNGIFHYQRTYLDERIREFVAVVRKDREGQARRLHDALGDFFLRWFESRGASIPPM